MQRRTTWILAMLASVLCAGLVVWLAHGAKHTTPAPLTAATERHDESVPITLSPAPTPARAGIETAPDPDRERRTLVHIVRRGTATPVAGAELTIHSLHGQDLLVTTDATGGVAVAPATLAEARIEARAMDYCTGTYSVPTEVPNELTFELIPTGKFAVHVRDTAGTPLEYRVVSVQMDRFAVPSAIQDELRPHWPEFGSRERRSQTDARGDVIVDGMPHGLKLIVECQSSRVDAMLDPDLAITPVEIVVATEFCIIGQLVWEDGSPAFPLENGSPAAAQTVDSGGETSFTSAFVQKDGSFRLGPLPRGRALWKVIYPGQAVRCTNLVDGPVDVGKIVLKQSFMCAGRFVHSSHPDWYMPMGVRFLARRDGVTAARWHNIEPDGKFSILLLAGPATLDFSAQDRVLRSIDVVSPFQDLVVDLDQLLGSIRVVTEGGRVDAGLFVVMEPIRDEHAPKSSGGTLHFGKVGSNQGVRECEGGFRLLTVPPGTYDVCLIDRESTGASRRLGRAVVTAGNESVVDASKIAPAELLATVQNSEGKPVADLDVEARFGTTIGFQGVISAKTNAAGVVAFSNISPGSWVVLVAGRGAGAPEAQRIELGDGEKRSLSIVVGKFGRIRGTVTQHGKPASDVTITAWLANGSGWGSPHKSTGDERGRFALDRLIEGRYQLNFNQGDPRTPTPRFMMRQVDVSADGEVLCDVDLESDLRPVIVRIDGKEFDDLDGGMILTPDGYGLLQRRPERENRWCVNVRSGPALFRFQSKTFSRHELDGRVDRPMLFAFAPTLEPGDGPIVVDLRGATIVVHLADPNAMFPVAKVIAVPGIGNVKSRLDGSPIAHEDAGDERTFRFVAVGSTITLGSSERAPSDLREVTLTVTNESTLRVEWPPR
jgi:hypothetical protein